MLTKNHDALPYLPRLTLHSTCSIRLSSYHSLIILHDSCNNPATSHSTQPITSPQCPMTNTALCRTSALLFPCSLKSLHSGGVGILRACARAVMKVNEAEKFSTSVVLCCIDFGFARRRDGILITLEETSQTKWKALLKVICHQPPTPIRHHHHAQNPSMPIPISGSAAFWSLYCCFRSCLWCSTGWFIRSTSSRRGCLRRGGGGNSLRKSSTVLSHIVFDLMDGYGG